jgi:hypothetical protein
VLILKLKGILNCFYSIKKKEFFRTKLFSFSLYFSLRYKHKMVREGLITINKGEESAE